MKVLVTYLCAVGWIFNLSAQSHKEQFISSGSCIYKLTPPPGWVIDLQSGRQEALAVFYPEGGSWASSDFVMYTNYESFTPTITNVDQFVQEDITDGYSTNSQITINHKYNLVISEKISADIVYYTGYYVDNHLSYQATAYIPTRFGISIVILQSNNEGMFYDSISAFESVVKSFVFVESTKLN